jgi:WD40 repeat protein
MTVFEGLQFPVYSMAYSHDHRQIASSDGDKIVRLWYANTSENTHSLYGHAQLSLASHILQMAVRLSPVVLI